MATSSAAVAARRAPADRVARAVDRWLLPIYVVGVTAYLILPVAVMILFSFNDPTGRSNLVWREFSLDAWLNPLGRPGLGEAVRNSLVIAITSATLAAVFGTMAALGMERMSARARTVFDGLFAAAIVVPGVVIGIATLVALVAVFGAVNPALAALWPSENPPKLGLGYGSIIAAHGLFSLALVTMMPLLTLYGDLLGILGGGLIGVTLLDISPTQYFHQTRAALTLGAFAQGLIKSGVYGMLVALAGCLRGMQCGRSAAAVGQATTSAVVTGIVSIIVASATLTVIFYQVW